MTGRILRTLCAALGALSIGACDGLAQRELRPGESTVDDVRRLLGTPGTVWEEADGSQVMEFDRGPEGRQTWMVEIGPDGRFRRMVNALTLENFARVVPGASRDDVRRLLGKPTETARFALRPEEEVWTWRFQAPGRDPELFHARIGPDGRVVSTETQRDPRGSAGVP